MTKKVWEMSALQAHELLKKKEISASEILEISIESIEEEKTHKQNMLPVNFRRDRRAICPLTRSLASDRPTLVCTQYYIYILY